MEYSLAEIKDKLQKQISLIKSDFKVLSEEKLNQKTDVKSWSILECIEHLNLYSSYYNREIKRALGKLEGSSAVPFKLSWLGKKSINAIKAENTKKQKTFKHMNPNSSQLEEEVLENFIQHQKDLIALIDATANLNLNKKKVRIEFFKLVKLSVYETFVFMIEHQNRHIQQALRAKAAFQQQKEKQV